jgi:hypothetical protein
MRPSHTLAGISENTDPPMTPIVRDPEWRILPVWAV